jgi:ribosomal protein S30
MSDYNKQTVANLRQLLKDRGIPSTGLTRKAQIIEKLEEWDVKESASAEAEESAQGVDAKAAVNEEATIEGGIENGDEASRQAESSLPVPTGDVSPSQDVEPEAPAVIAPAPDVAVEHVEVDTGLEHQAPEADVSEQPQPEPTNTAVEDTSVPMDDAQPTIVTQPVEPSPTLDAASTEQIVPDEKAPAIAQPVETSHTPDMVSTEQTPSSAPDEEPSIEKVQLLPIPERSATTTAEPGTRLNTEELEAETRKRKRRSQTPELTSQDIRVKKSRPDNDNAPDVLLREDKAEDTDTVMEQRAPEAEEKEVDQEVIDTTTNGDTQASTQPEPPTAATAEESRSDEATPAAPAPEKKEKAPRFRELLKPVDTMESTAPNTSSLVSDDRPIVPALHVATPAIYIRDLMRPLRPDQLRAHLVSLASPPSGSPNPSIIKSMFLVMIPIYAVVSFLSYLYYQHAIYFELGRDCYEAFAISSFFTLMCHYIAPNLHEQKEYFRSVEPKNWVWPVNWMQKCTGGETKGWLRKPSSGLTWFNVCICRVILQESHWTVADLYRWSG